MGQDREESSQERQAPQHYDDPATREELYNLACKWLATPWWDFMGRYALATLVMAKIKYRLGTAVGQKTTEGKPHAAPHKPGHDL